MRVAFDIRYLSHGLTGGVRTYVHHLARCLPLAAPDWPFFFYADGKAEIELTQPLPDNVTLRVLPWRSGLSSVVNDHRIGRWMQRDRVEVAHFPATSAPPGPTRWASTAPTRLNLFGLA